MLIRWCTLDPMRVWVVATPDARWATRSTRRGPRATSGVLIKGKTSDAGRQPAPDAMTDCSVEPRSCATYAAAGLLLDSNGRQGQYAKRSMPRGSSGAVDARARCEAPPGELMAFARGLAVEILLTGGGHAVPMVKPSGARSSKHIAIGRFAPQIARQALSAC